MIEASAFEQVRLLSGNLFTPLTRTPWAGRTIASRFKSAAPETPERIGESWELSCDPDFPSRLVDLDISLGDAVREHAADILSPAQVKEHGPQLDLVVKLLDADLPLSVQVHPADRHPALAPDECGKAESWLILHAAPGAGLYLGFSRAMNRDELRDSFARGGEDAAACLRFVPVQAGDWFEIAPGLPHAIGPGVTLLEPQCSLSGKRAKTLRLYDWDRRYAPTGELDLSNGSPRALHVEESLSVFDPGQFVDDSFLETIRRYPAVASIRRGVWIEEYPQNSHYQVVRLNLLAGAHATLVAPSGFVHMVVTEGALTTMGANDTAVVVTKGTPALAPWRSLPLRLAAKENTTALLVLPSGSGFAVD